MTPREVALPPVSIDPEELARRLVSPMPKPPYEVVAHRADKPLKVGEIEIPCFVLENEVRVLSQRATVGAVSLSRSHLQAGSGRGSEIADFDPPEWLRPFIHADLSVALKSPIPFSNPEATGVVYGFPATMLVDLCRAITEAHRRGATTSRQEGIVERASVLIGGFAKVGIIALVDEATGYQRIRAADALHKLLQKYLSEELQPWVRTFPFEFYELLFKLKGQGIPPPNGQMPGWVANDTIDLVYARMPPGILEEVTARTPRLPSGQLKNRLHQWFNPEHGHPKLREQINLVMAFMQASRRWSGFLNRLDRARPKHHTDTSQLRLDLEQKSQRDLPGI